MGIKLNFNFFNISFRIDNTPDVRIPSSASQARKGGAQSAGIKEGALSSKPPTIHRYSAVTVWILDKLSKAAGDWMMSNKERISKQVIDGKVVYLNKKDLEAFQRHMEGLPAANKLNNPISESERGLTDWIEKWKTAASKTHGVALQHSTFKPQDGGEVLSSKKDDLSEPDDGGDEAETDIASGGRAKTKKILVIPRHSMLSLQNQPSPPASS